LNHDSCNCSHSDHGELCEVVLFGVAVCLISSTLSFSAKRWSLISDSSSLKRALSWEKKVCMTCLNSLRRVLKLPSTLICVPKMYRTLESVCWTLGFVYQTLETSPVRTWSWKSFFSSLGFALCRSSSAESLSLNWYLSLSSRSVRAFFKSPSRALQAPSWCLNLPSIFFSALLS